jgi:predicted XRE-type DNA-binding protein
MEIKQKLEMSIVNSRRFVIRQQKSAEQVSCAECGSAMLKTEQAAVLFGINQRRIFQFIETGAAHFAETATGAMMICLSSLDASVGGKDEKKLNGDD